MRAPLGLGLIVLGSFVVACGSDAGNVAVEGYAPSSTTPEGDDHGRSTPTDPRAPGAIGHSDAQSEDSSSPDATPAPIASGITLTDVAIFQAVKVPVVAGGQLVGPSTRKAPVVAERTGMIRIYVQPDKGWTPKDITAELRLVSGGKKLPILRETKRITGASKEEDPLSTFNLEVPGESLPSGVMFQVALTAPDGEAADQIASSDGRYPRDGSVESLGAEVAGKLRVVLVPVKYDADGSGRTPKLGPAELELYRRRMMRLYPTTEVELTPRAPMPWDGQIGANGSGFSNVLRAITELRQKDGADKDVYYYGLFAPKATMGAFCGGRCVTGLSTVVKSPKDASLRVSIGLGFGDEASASTMAHELGHAHGREHAPCGGASGVDPQFPYQGGAIGTWGYDIFDKTLIAPSKGRDIMGYCRNEWVSDYTYNAFFERIAAINGETGVFSLAHAPEAAPKEAARVRYRVATVGADDAMTWDGELEFDEELTGGELRRATFFAESGAALATRPARLFRFDHLPGGFLFVPKDPVIDATAWRTMTVDGSRAPLARPR